MINLARAHGLSGIEVPLAHCVPGLSKTALTQLKKNTDKAGLFLSVDAEVAGDSTFSETLAAASHYGESFVRVKLSKTLGGNRYLTCADPRESFTQTLHRLKQIAPLARNAGIKIAIENHQDVTSEELIRLIQEVGQDVLGVNFDTGSALATCEDPVEFASAIAPYLLNLHLKDYRLASGPQGFRLVRCSLGHGVVDFQAIFKVAREHALSGTRASIELGAVVAREVHWLNPAYWRAYPERTAGKLVPFLRLLLDRLEADESAWQTPWEREETHEQLERTELKELFESVEFLRSLGASIGEGVPKALTTLSELGSPETLGAHR
ncbi:MAG: sugar phosphate isomerase/epimerase [Candidatus Omnitrophica bacterium]|nr:sugar phosphate isomerase/epimerase [Candidatus Omnitrophota bacterium]